MKINRTPCLFMIFTIAMQLVACGVTTSMPNATATMVPSPTLPLVPTSIEQPPTSLSTSTPIPISNPPDGLRMAYVVDGNLYYQNGNNPPLQLTYGGEDRSPLSFSEDEKKVFFIRGRQEIYSINLDGGKEQALVTNDLLLPFGADFDETTTPCNPALVPNAHLLLFQTCSHPEEFTTIRNSDLFSVNTDTHEVKRLLSQGQGGSFDVSPDGNTLAIDRQNAIDVLGIDGKLIHSKIATYPHSEPESVGAKMYWLPDSSELILALPINKLYDTSVPPTYAIWRYSPDTNTAIQVNFDPPLMSNEKNWVSPDGHWITYINFNEGFFLGDLRDGRTQPYPNPSLPHEWSPDSIHFVYETFPSGKLVLYLASVNDAPILIGEGSDFLGWLDASKYLYYSDKTFVVGEIGKEPMPILVGNAQLLFPGHPDSFIFTYQNP